MALRNRGGKWHYRFKVDGKHYGATTGLAATKRNETKAQQVEVEHRQALLEGRNPSRKIQVREFSDAAREFLEWAKMRYRAHPNSYLRIATSFASAKEFFGRKAVSLIDDGELEDFKAWRANKHKIRDITLRHDLHALSTFFRYAIKKRWARENPVRSVAIPSDAEAVRIHVIDSDEEKHYFLRAAKHQDLSDLAQLILNQGMRPDEVLALRREDIDLERGQLFVRKGKSPAARRILDLTTESRRILSRRLEGNSPWIFRSKRNPGMRLTRLNGAHDRLCAGALEEGVSLRFVLYDFRHTFATRLAQAGIDLATIAAILGHSSIRIVERYVHPTASHKRDAMLRYDEIMRTGREAPEGRPN
jgi:integrase